MQLRCIKNTGCCEDASTFFINDMLQPNPDWPLLAAKELGESKPSWVLPAPYAFWLETWPG